MIARSLRRTAAAAVGVLAGLSLGTLLTGLSIWLVVSLAVATRLDPVDHPLLFTLLVVGGLCAASVPAQAWAVVAADWWERRIADLPAGPSPRSAGRSVGAYLAGVAGGVVLPGLLVAAAGAWHGAAFIALTCPSVGVLVARAALRGAGAAPSSAGGHIPRVRGPRIP